MRRAELTSLLEQKDLLIFDLDGTIADTSPLHSRGFREAFARYGANVDYELIAGLTTAAAVEKIAKDAQLELSADERAAMVLDKQTRVRRLIETELEPLEGSVDFVRAAGKRFTLSLCTSASRATAELSLCRLGIGECFSSIFTADDISVGKPSPEVFLRSLERHRIGAERAIIFEDADSGLAAAAAAEIDAIRIVRRRAGPREATWVIISQALCGLAR